MSIADIPGQCLAEICSDGDEGLYLIGVGDEGGVETLGLLPKDQAADFIRKANCPWIPWAQKAKPADLIQYKVLDHLPYCPAE